MPKGIYLHKEHTIEWKENMHKKMKGNTNGFKVGHTFVRSKESYNNPNVLLKLSMARKGKKHSIQTRLKLSESHKGIKCHLWRGGITEENHKIRTGIEFRLWREAVFARDNWTCQHCGDNKGGNLNPHHIQNFSSFPELRFAIDNGITLCEKCHISFHKKYGTKNNTKGQIDDFLNVDKTINN